MSCKRFDKAIRAMTIITIGTLVFIGVITVTALIMGQYYYGM